MPAVSKKQQKFFGIVRSIQKGEQAPTTPETAKAAEDMKKGDVKKFASTKHKGLPEKKKIEEDRQIKKIIKQLRKSVKAHDKQADTLEKKIEEEKKGDHEPEMIRNQLKTAGRASKRIKKHTRKKDDFKAWVQSKITKASDYLDTAADYLDSKDMKEESNPRIPRKKGQPANSKKHSDLYTDENPKGTIHGLGFKDVATSKASVSKIRNSSRSHAHKIQAAVAMEQRAREMGKTSEAAVYRKYINSMKKKTKSMKEETKLTEFISPDVGYKGGEVIKKTTKKVKDFPKAVARVGVKGGVIGATALTGAALAKRLMKKSNNIKEQITFPQMQQRVRDAKERRREQQKKSEKLYMDTKKKGVKFYDKKGVGRLKDGKKVYD